MAIKPMDIRCVACWRSTVQGPSAVGENRRQSGLEQQSQGDMRDQSVVERDRR